MLELWFTVLLPAFSNSEKKILIIKMMLMISVKLKKKMSMSMPIQIPMLMLLLTMITKMLMTIMTCYAAAFPIISISQIVHTLNLATADGINPALPHSKNQTITPVKVMLRIYIINHTIVVLFLQSPQNLKP